MCVSARERARVRACGRARAQDSLEVRGKRTLRESLDFYVQGELMEGDNQYFCEEAGRKARAGPQSADGAVVRPWGVRRGPKRLVRKAGCRLWCGPAPRSAGSACVRQSTHEARAWAPPPAESPW